jgi:ribosome maturation factor RimP
VGSSAHFFFGKNMSNMDVTGQVESIIKPVLDAEDFELVDIEYKREGQSMVLRLYIDKEGGITLDDCSTVSHELSNILDIEDIISGQYTLEVSSPGINRPLKKVADYERYTGEFIKIRTFEMLPDDSGNKRKTFLGKLLSISDGLVKLHLKEGQNVSIPFEKIAKANLEFEF